MLKLNRQTTKSTRKVVVIMDSIITYLLAYNQYLIKIIYQLILFISKHIPLKQMAFDDSNSPEYQKFKVEEYNIVEQSGKIIQYSLVDNQYIISDVYKNEDEYVSTVFTW